MFELFEKIAATNSRNEKIALLETATKDQKELLSACYNPYRQFHIKKWNFKPNKSGKFLNNKVAIINFFNLLTKLEESNRSNLMVSEVEEFFSKCSEEQSKWFELILKKDMKIGINVRTINSALGVDTVPVFEVMLANRYGSGTIAEFPTDEDHWIIQPKLDGFRAILQGWNGVFVGRSGKSLPNENIAKLVDNINYDFVFDGELYSHEISFNALSSILRNETASIPNHVKFVIWDMIPKENWIKRKSVMPYHNRLSILNKFVNDIGSDFFQVIPYSVMYSTQKKEYLSFFGKKRLNLIPFKNLYSVYDFYINKGYEGAMAKKAIMPYEWRRSLTNMYKIKPEETTDALIVGMYEGTGKYKNQLGGFEVIVDDDIKVKVGGGFSDEQRIAFWNDESIINNWCEIKFTEKSYAGGSNKATSLRHPRFIRIRDEK